MVSGYIYYAIEPLVEEYREDSSVSPSFTIPVKTESKDYEVALFSKNDRPYMLRIKICDLQSKDISDELWSRVDVLKEHMISVLRLGYDKNAELFDLHFHTFVEDDEDIQFGISIGTDFPEPEYDADKVKDLFVGTFSLRHQMRLLTDSTNEHVPLQFRYLSLYKLLEHEFQEDGEWKDEFEEFIKQFEDKFAEKDITEKNLKNYVHMLRDRCAHIKSNNDALGVTELDKEDKRKVRETMPIMREICAEYINTQYPDSVNIAFPENASKEAPGRRFGDKWRLMDDPSEQ